MSRMIIVQNEDGSCSTIAPATGIRDVKIFPAGDWFRLETEQELCERVAAQAAPGRPFRLVNALDIPADDDPKRAAWFAARFA